MSRRSGGSVWPSAATLRPASRTSPLLIGRKPATALSRVDLPEPDGPSSATTSPASTVRFTELRTGVEPYAIDSSRSSRTFDTGLCRTGRASVTTRPTQGPQCRCRQHYDRRDEYRQRGRYAHATQVGTVQYDDSESFAARPVKQARHGHLVHSGQETHSPSSEQGWAQHRNHHCEQGRR